MARILVIEDDISISRLLVDFLESHGHVVPVARDGAQAIQYVDLRRPDAIVLDLMLPVITGVEVARRLRLDPDTSDIPILAVTAVDGPDDLAEVLMVDAIVSKPFALETIEAELARLLDQHAAPEFDDTASSSPESISGQ